MIEAVNLVDHLDPRECRRHVQNHFSITRMAYKYLELYHEIIDNHKMIEVPKGLPDIRLSKPNNHSIPAI